MSPILFYGVPSGCSFGSIVALEWSGLPYRLCRIEMPGGFTEAFRQVNPVPETPALLDAEGQPLSESLAILNHIGAAGLAGGFGEAQGTRGFDRLNQMLAWLNTTFFNAFAPLWHVLEHGLEGDAAAALRAYGRAAVVDAHARLDAMIGDRRWLLGDRRTLADAYFAGIARWTRYHDVVERRDYPNVARVFDALQRDPAVVFAHAIERGEAATGAGGFAGHVSLADAVRERAPVGPLAA